MSLFRVPTGTEWSTCQPSARRWFSHAPTVSSPSAPTRHARSSVFESIALARNVRNLPRSWRIVTSSSSARARGDCPGTFRARSVQKTSVSVAPRASRPDFGAGWRVTIACLTTPGSSSSLMVVAGLGGGCSSARCGLCLWDAASCKWATAASNSTDSSGKCKWRSPE